MNPLVVADFLSSDHHRRQIGDKKTTLVDLVLVSVVVVESPHPVQITAHQDFSCSENIANEMFTDK